MKKEFIDLVGDIAPIIFIVSIASSFLKGARRVIDYIKSLIASYLLGIPAALLMEYFFPGGEAWGLKYMIVLTVGTFGVCLFNGTFKVIKHFEEEPEEFIERIRHDSKRHKEQ